MFGEHRERSMAVNVPVAGCKYVYEPSLSKQILLSVIKSSILSPRLLLANPIFHIRIDR